VISCLGARFAVVRIRGRGQRTGLLTGLPGLDGHQLGAGCPGLQGCGDAGQDRFGGHPPVQQQHLDQRPRPGGVAVRGAGGRPERVMGRGERPVPAGLGQAGRSGQRAGPHQQDLQIVVQGVAVVIAAGQPRILGDDLVAVKDQQLISSQADPDLPADEPGRHRVVALPDHDPRVAAHGGRQRDAAVVLLGRQRHEQVPLGGEAFPDARCLAVHVPVVLGLVDRGQPLVQLGQGLHLGHRDQVGAAEPAALVLDPALLVRALQAGYAVERVEPGLPGVQQF
jgi:hypothetical protein